MKYLLIPGLFVFLLSCSHNSQRTPMEILYVGTFANEGLFIYHFDRSNDSYRLIQQVDSRGEPSFQALHPTRKYLYSVSSESMDETENGSVSAFRIDPKNGMLTLLNEASSLGRDACHVSVHPSGDFIYISNYSSGNLSVYRVASDGSIGELVQMVQHEGSSVNRSRQNGPHTHSAIPSQDGRFLYISDLGSDRIYFYAVDSATGKLSPATVPFIETPLGAGPRHLTMLDEFDVLYSLEELSGHVSVYWRDAVSGAIQPIQRVNALPDNFEGYNTSADIHISADKRFLYASNRGHDSIAIFTIEEDSGALRYWGHAPAGGGHPRNFRVDPENEYIWVANRDGNHVRVFGRNQETGVLTLLPREVSVPKPVCVTYLALEK